MKPLYLIKNTFCFSSSNVTKGSAAVCSPGPPHCWLKESFNSPSPRQPRRAFSLPMYILALTDCYIVLILPWLKDPLPFAFSVSIYILREISGYPPMVKTHLSPFLRNPRDTTNYSCINYTTNKLNWFLPQQ